MDNIARLNASLNRKARVYSELAKQPQWWKSLLQIEGVYVEIRKGDIVDVYYEGGRIAEIRYKGKGKRKGLVATCNEKYLGYEKGAKSKYIDSLETLKTNPQFIIENIKKHYSQKHDPSGENIGETKLKGDMICSNRGRFLDSEFAHRYEKDNSNTIRIDLVDIKDNKLQFIELKRIQDNRLLNRDDDNPEILEQVEKYRKFIEVNREALLVYYKELYRIKEYLGLPVPKCDLGELSVCAEPLLIIRNTYEKTKRDCDEERRADRIDRIEKILEERNIYYKIIKK